MKRIILLACISIFGVNLAQSQIDYGSIKLFNADTELEVLEITDGATYSLANVGANLNVVAEPPVGIGSVLFETSVGESRTESGAPYAFLGDNTTDGNTNYFPWTTLPNHLGTPITFNVSYYSESGANGTLLGDDVFTVTFVEDDNPGAGSTLITGLTAEQSSNFRATQFLASDAVDGNVNTFSTTANVNPSWLRVDLGNMYDVSRVVLYNRTNCCPERLANAQILYSNTLSDDPTTFTSTGLISNSDLVQDYPGQNFNARYIMILGGGFLSIANIEVYGSLSDTSNNVPVTGVTISPTSSNLEVGGTATLAAGVAPNNATNGSITWSSSNASVATVTQGGAVTAISAGSAVIRATSGENTTIFDEVTVTVTASNSGGGSSPWTTNGDNISFDGGNIGVGLDNPARTIHIDNGGIRLDRRSNSAFFMLHRKTSSGAPLSTFFFGLDASNTNNGKFFIGDMGTRVGGGSDRYLTISRGGNVGVGTFDPTSRLHVSSGTSGDAILMLEADTDNNDEADNPMMQFRQDGGAIGVNLGFSDENFGANVFGIGTKSGNTESWDTFTVNPQTGNVGIGTNDAGTDKLAVNGTIHAREVRVDLTGWPDYVFKSNYNLPTLEEVQEHIKEKGHLPNIPSAQEIETNGIKLGEMNKLLLEKIEEQMLYILQLEQRINKLEREE